MKYYQIYSSRLVLGWCSLGLSFLCLSSVRAFSLSESYGNFINRNNNGFLNSESAEPSYEAHDSNQIENIGPSGFSPPPSTQYVTAKRYDDPQGREDNESYSSQVDGDTFPSDEQFLYTTKFPENPPLFSSLPPHPTKNDNIQPDFSSEGLDSNDGNPPPPMMGDSVETTTESFEPLAFVTPSESSILNYSTPNMSLSQEKPSVIPIPAVEGVENKSADPMTQDQSSLGNNELGEMTAEPSTASLSISFPDPGSRREEERAELVMEPVPTPMMLISSNGEGSNPPLEEEFAEAFKKFGPNGRRRRIRPGGGRRRVRMRVKKLNRSGSSVEIVEPSISPSSYPTHSFNSNPTSVPEDGNGEEPRLPQRRRRYRSTTPSPDITFNEPKTNQINQMLPHVTMTPTPTTTSLNNNGPKQPVVIKVGNIHSHGSTGFNNVNLLQEPQLEKPGGPGGFTEQISTYFFTPPSRISTTVEPKMSQGNESNNNVIVLKSPAENPLHSSFSLKSHLWDTAIEKSNDILEPISTTILPTKNEPQKSESTRKAVQTPMEDRNFSVQPNSGNPELMDYDGRRNPAFPPDNMGENPFNYNGGMNVGGADGFFANQPPFNRLENKGPPFPQSNNLENHQPRSHYDRTKDPFFISNQFFKNSNPFPSSSAEHSGNSRPDEYPHHNQHDQGMMIPPFGPPPPSEERESSQMQLPLFDQNGEYVSTASPNNPGSEQFYAPPPPPPENPEDHPPGDYGTSTHYTPSEFKSSPTDPTTRKGRNGRSRSRSRSRSRGAFTQLQRPTFTEGDFPNFENQPPRDSGVGVGVGSPPSEPDYPAPQTYSPNNEEGVRDISTYPGDISENLIHPEGGGGSNQYMDNGGSPTAMPLQFTEENHTPPPEMHQKEFSHNNYDHQLPPSQGGNELMDNGLELSNYTNPEYNVANNEISNSLDQSSLYDGVPVNHNMSPNDGGMLSHSHPPPPGYPYGPGGNGGIEPGRFISNRPMGHPPMHHHHRHHPPNHFFMNSAPPPPPNSHNHNHHHNHMMHHPRFGQRLPLPNTPLYSVMNPNGFGGRPSADFHNSSPHVNMPMPGLSNIPPPPSEQQAFAEVLPHHHFPPHTHSMSDQPDYEPANPPLPPGHPMMDQTYPPFGREVNNHLDDTQSHFEEHHSTPPGQSGSGDPMTIIDHHHHQNHRYPPHSNGDHGGGGGNGGRPISQSPPGFDIMSAYYDKPPPTIGSEYEQNVPNKVPFQYSSSDGGGLDSGIFSSNSNSQNGKQNSQKENEPSFDSQGDTQSNKDSTKVKGSSTEDKNLTAMYSETPYVLMFPQLVPEEAMIPPPPKILNKEVPVVQASSMSSMQFTPEGKPVLGPGLKAVPVHPRHQMYQVLAKAHYDKALQKYMEARKKPPSAIYTPYGILVPMGPSAAASTNNENYAKFENHQASHGKPSSHPKDPHERQLLHLLLGKKSPLGHFHLFKSASIKNGRLKNQFDFKANVDPALDLLAEKLALKLSAAKYLLTVPAKLKLRAFGKHAASYSDHAPVIESPQVGGGLSHNYVNNVGLGSELKEILAATQKHQHLSNYEQKQAKGEEVDPELKAEIKNMLKDRLREILEESESQQPTMDMEKEHLAALASNLINTRAQFSGSPSSNQQYSSSSNNKWSNYFPPSNGGLFGSIKRLFFGNPISTSTIGSSDRASDTDGLSSSQSGIHPFGTRYNFLNTVGRMGLLGGRSESSSSSRSPPTTEALDRLDPFRRGGAGGSPKKVKKQLEKWLDMVLKTSDMSTSESSNHPVFIKFPTDGVNKASNVKTGRATDSNPLFSSGSGNTGNNNKPQTASEQKSSLSSLSLPNNLSLPASLAQKLSSGSIVPSNFLASHNWTPMVSSAFRSVFNISPTNTQTQAGEVTQSNKSVSV